MSDIVVKVAASGVTPLDALSAVLNAVERHGERTDQPADIHIEAAYGVVTTGGKVGTWAATWERRW